MSGSTNTLGGGGVQNATAAPGSSFATLLATTVVDATNKHGVRSSKRTDDIHACIKMYIESQNSRVTCIVEHNLVTKLGGFDVDVAVFDKETNKLVACLLFKGLTSSIKKNEKNYEHNKIGEAVKAKSGMGDAKLVYLDVVPVRCPTYGSGEDIKCWESHTPDAVRLRSNTVLEVVNSISSVPIIDDIYTVSVDYGYGDGKIISFTRIVDDSDMERFDALIHSLAPAAK